MLPIFNSVSDSQKHLKNWGFENWLINKDFCGKILTFNKAGDKCSLHFHLKKSELFLFQSKFIFVWIDTDTATEYTNEMLPGFTIYIPQGVPHQLIALEDNAEVIEFSSHHEDSDSYRIRR